MTQLKVPKQLAYELTCPTVRAGEEYILGWAEALELGIHSVVENRPTGEHRRWTLIYELVIRTADQRLWRRLYEVGATENQYELPFEDEGPEIPFDLCEAVEVRAVDYRPVPRGR